jgi:hypothetical protein
VRAQCVTYVERRSRVLSVEVGVADMHSAYKNEWKMIQGKSSDPFGTEDDMESVTVSLGLKEKTSRHRSYS